jgi:hypothetical protein
MNERSVHGDRLRFPRSAQRGNGWTTVEMSTLSRRGRTAAAPPALILFWLGGVSCRPRMRGRNGFFRTARRPTGRLRRFAFERVGGACELDREFPQSVLREQIRTLAGHSVAIARVLAENLRVHVSGTFLGVKAAVRLRFPMRWRNLEQCHGGNSKKLATLSTTP